MLVFGGAHCRSRSLWDSVADLFIDAGIDPQFRFFNKVQEDLLFLECTQNLMIFSEA